MSREAIRIFPPGYEECRACRASTKKNEVCKNCGFLPFPRIEMGHGYVVKEGSLFCECPECAPQSWENRKVIPKEFRHAAKDAPFPTDPLRVPDIVLDHFDGRTRHFYYACSWDDSIWCLCPECDKKPFSEKMIIPEGARGKAVFPRSAGRDLGRLCAQVSEAQFVRMLRGDDDEVIELDAADQEIRGKILSEDKEITKEDWDRYCEIFLNRNRGWDVFRDGTPIQQELARAIRGCSVCVSVSNINDACHRCKQTATMEVSKMVHQPSVESFYPKGPRASLSEVLVVTLVVLILLRVLSLWPL